MRHQATILMGIVAALASGCKDNGKDASSDDTSPTTQTTDSGTTDDTAPPTDDTGTTLAPPEVLESPEAVDPEALSACTTDAPSLEVRYAGASPHVASVPIAVIDGVVNGADVAAEGFCLEQTFADGGQLTRCGRTDIQGASAYLQGAPAPGQDVTLRLGVMVGDALCWADDAHELTLGDVTTPGFGYAPVTEKLTTPDYPPAAMGMLNIDGKLGLYAMALMDAPAYGISGGDILWYFNANNYAVTGSTPIIETNHFDNGLLTFTIEDHLSTDKYEVFDADFGGITTANIDVAGFEWLRADACTDADDASCMGFIHHGNAVMGGADVNVTMAYERLYDEAGDPYFFQNQYYLIGATFQGHAMTLHGELEKTFDISFHDLFEMDPNESINHGPRYYEGPDGASNRTAYYVNAADVVADEDDPELYHLTGTLTARPYNGFYHIALTADGALSEYTLYNNQNDALTWNTLDGDGPLDDLGHSVEYIGVDAAGGTHFLVYDRSVKKVPTVLSQCAGFYHVVDRDGQMLVGGPYHNRAATEEDGDVCGNSLSYGNVNALYGVTVEGYDDPVNLAISFDNAGLPSDQGGQWGEISTVYAPGTPRLMGVFVNEDRFDPDGWHAASTYVGHNVDGNNPAGFNSLITDWPTLFVADAPFVLNGL